MSECSLQSPVIKQESKSDITALEISEGFSLPTASIKSEPEAEPISIKSEPDCYSLPSSSENEQKFAVRSVKSEPEYSEQSPNVKYEFKTCYVKRAGGMDSGSSRSPPLGESGPCSSERKLLQLEPVDPCTIAAEWERFEQDLPTSVGHVACVLTTTTHSTTKKGARSCGTKSPSPPRPKPSKSAPSVPAHPRPHARALTELLDTVEEGLRAKLVERFRAAHLEAIQQYLALDPFLNLDRSIVAMARAPSTVPYGTTQLPALDKAQVLAMIERKQCPICHHQYDTLTSWGCSGCRSYGYRIKRDPPYEWPGCLHTVSKGKNCTGCRFTVYCQVESLFVAPMQRRRRKSNKRPK